MGAGHVGARMMEVKTCESRAQVATAALRASDCVLATHEHLRLPGFPLSRFQYLLEYVEEVRGTPTQV